MASLKVVMLMMANLVTRMCSSLVNLFPLKIVTRLASTQKRLDLLPIRKELEQFEGGSVELEMDEGSGIAVLTLNNPQRLNSVTGKMMVDMADCITELEKWSKGKGLIVKGTGGTFCSGGDLTFVRKALHYGAEMAAFQHDTLTRLLNLPLVSVALLQGHALGGGAELSTACDFRVMSSSAKVGFVHIKMGLTTGWGATTRLVHKLGRQRAVAMLCSAKVFTAEEAQTEGLVDHILPYSVKSEDEFQECKKWLISSYCKHDADLIQATKASIVYSDLHRDPYVSLHNEREVFTRYWGGPAQLAALKANIKHK